MYNNLESDDFILFKCQNVSIYWISVVKSTDRDTIRYWNFKNVLFPLRFERCWADY